MTNLKRRGFSLVELLVVLGIIVALLGILLPVFSRAREISKRTVCVSNVRQLTAAWLMYAGENGGHICSSNCQMPQYPVLVPSSDGLVEWYAIAGVPLAQSANFFWSWAAWVPNDPTTYLNPGYHVARDDVTRGMLWPYLKNQSVYVCPNTPILPNAYYAINGLLAGPRGLPRTIMTLGQIKRSEATFVFIEEFNWASMYGSRYTPGTTHGFLSPIYPTQRGWGLFAGDSGSDMPGNYHPSGGTNGSSISFADGHAMFWQYSSPSTGTHAYPATNVMGETALRQQDSPDVFQLEAWSGGPVPPNVSQ